MNDVYIFQALLSGGLGNVNTKRWGMDKRLPEIALNSDHIAKFLKEARSKLTKEQWWKSYQYWARADSAWQRQFGRGGTDIQSALAWYQHIYKPGSKEWRPKIIIKALLDSIEELKDHE